MRTPNDSKYLLIAFLPLLILLALLVVQSRTQFSGLVAVTPSISSFFDREIEFTTGFYGLRYKGTSSNLIDVHVLYFGAFEKPVLRSLEDTAHAIQDDPVTFVDVGANTGQHTIFAARFSRHVHSFEPFPPVLERLNGMVEMNSLTNVTVYPVGLGVEEAVLDFYAPPASNQGTGSFVSEFEPMSGEVSQLRIVPGDEFFEEVGITTVDLMKIDVEGFERPVLEGLRSTLAAQRPVIVMELTVKAGLEPLFGSEVELRSVLPQGYGLALLDFGESEYLNGNYSLKPFEVDFDTEAQATVVAYPAELESKIPRESGTAPSRLRLK